MASAQLKMWMCSLGIVWIQNKSEKSQWKKPWIMRLYSDKGPRKGAKQTSGHNCLPFKGATQAPQHMVWGDSGMHGRSHWERLFLFQRPGSQMRMEPTEVWSELYSPFLIWNLISQLHHLSHSLNLAPKDIYCFQNSSLSHKGQGYAVLAQW